MSRKKPEIKWDNLKKVLERALEIREQSHNWKNVAPLIEKEFSKKHPELKSLTRDSLYKALLRRDMIKDKHCGGTRGINWNQMDEVLEDAVEAYSATFGNWRDTSEYITDEWQKKYPQLSELTDVNLKAAVQASGLTVQVKGTKISLKDLKNVPGNLELTAKKMVVMLQRRGNLSMSDLSRRLNKSKQHIVKLIDNITKAGFSIELDKVRKRVTLYRHNDSSLERSNVEMTYFGDVVRFGVVGDMQFGSKYQQETRLNECYEIGEREGIHAMLNPGDVHDGIRMYRGQEQEIFLHGADEQRDYAIEHYPRSNLFKTHMISGNHDLVFKKIAGYDIVKGLCAARDDLVYEGEICADFTFQNIIVRLLHPTGGVAYARSYKPQKIAEGMTAAAIDELRGGDPEALPHMLVMGHWHVTNYGRHMGVHCVCAPCLQAQTPYLAAKGLQPEIGMIIVHMLLHENNITRFQIEYFHMKPLKNDYRR